MRKLQIEDAEVMRIAIQQEIGRSEESRYDHRLHGLLLVNGGAIVPRSRGSVRRGRDDGAALGAPLRGRAVWTLCEKASERDDRARWMRRIGDAAGGSTQDPARLWLGRPPCGTVRSCRNICVGATRWTWGCGNASDYFDRLGFRLRKPRPQVAQSDPLKVAAVKKTPSPGSSSRRRTVESG